MTNHVILKTVGNGRVLFRNYGERSSEKSKNGLWMFEPVDNRSRKSPSQERVLITDICRGHNYPKQFTTYQIVSVQDNNICLGVQFSPDFVEEQTSLRVLPCYKNKGNTKTN